MLRTSYLLHVTVFIGCLCAARADACQDLDAPSLPEQFAGQFEPLAEADRLDLANHALAELTSLQHWLGQIDAVELSKWQIAFELDELETILKSDPQNIERLRPIERGFYGLTQGLNTQQVIPLRDALTRYVNFLIVYTQSDLPAEFARRLQILQTSLTDSSPPNAVEIARQVDWLITAGQTPELVSQLQQQFSHPCIVIDINMDYLSPYMDDFQKDVSESKFTTNRIVGVPVSGMSHFKAKISPALTINPDRATLRLEVDGVIDSPVNDSRPDPQRAPIIGNVSVALKTSGKTAVNGFKDIYWDGANLVAEPAHVQCQTESEVNNMAISRNYRFPKSRLARRVDKQIRKKANEEVQKKSPLANRESANIAERQISSQLDEEVQELLNNANAEIGEFYRAPLESLGLFPVSNSQSGVNAIRLGFRGPNYGGIGAPQKLSQRELIGDVEVNMHETVCTSLWAGYLRGRKIDDRDFKNIHRELRGFVPQELRIAGNQSWSVTLDSEAPLETEFRDGFVKLLFKIDSIVIEDKHYSDPFSVSASYQVKPEINMPKFQRVGDISVAWTPVPRRTAEEDSMLREFVAAKFDAFFARAMYMDGMSAPVGSEWGAASQLKIIDSEIKDGWWRVVFKTYNLNQLN